MLRQVLASAPSDLLENEEEAVAARSPVTFLITGPSGDIVETVARRIHTVRFDDAAPFVAMRTSLFPLPSGKAAATSRQTD